MVPTEIPRFPEDWEELLFRFDEAWNLRSEPSLREYLPQDAGPLFLLELVRIDLVRRTQHQHPVSIEYYLHALPELKSDSTTLEQIRQLASNATSSSSSVRDGLNSTRLDTKDSTADVPDSTDACSSHGASVVIQAVYDGLLRHAEGGLGEVLVAHEPLLNRRVAVKTLKKEWIANARARRDFLKEAEVTGRLDHPGIVPVHCLGNVADGRPCYSMRYVEGETLAAAIKRYHHGSTGSKDERAITFRTLLGRFVSICNTIAYAHSQGVLHRDLKPQNVMLGPFGETVVVDWGLAKITGADIVPDEGQSVPERSLEATRAGDVMGTPAYMSPEQATGSLDEISTATDVFGLGATLYSILTGAAPYSGKSPQAALEAARSAAFTPPHLVHAAPRALSAVCCKAMARRPGERYASALVLAADVERWLAGEAVSAWVEPWSTRLKRTIQRRKTLFSALAVLALVLPTAAFVSLWFVTQARAQAEIHRETARIKETATTQMTQYLVQLFQTADPVGLDTLGFRGPGERADDRLAQRLLGKGAQLVREHLKDQPLARADLMESIGNSYRNLGDWGEAEGYLRDAHEVRLQFLGGAHPATLDSSQSLARLAQDRGDYSVAESQFREVLRAREDLYGQEHLSVAETKFYLGWLTFHRPFSQEGPQFQKEKVQEAERLLNQSLSVRDKLLPKNHRDVGYTLAALASVKLSQGQQALALAYAGRALEVFRASDQDPTLGNIIVEVIRSEEHRSAGRFVQAEEGYLKILTLARRHLGAGHPISVMQLANLAGLYIKKGDEVKAEKVAREILDLVRLNPFFRSQPVIVDGMILFTDRIRARGDVAAARGFYEEALRYARERPAGNEANVDKLKARLQSLNESR